MTPAAQKNIAHCLNQMSIEAIQNWMDNINDAEHWAIAFNLMQFLSPELCSALAQHFTQFDDKRLKQIFMALDNVSRLSAVVETLTSFSASLQQQLIKRLLTVDPALRLHLIRSASSESRTLVLQKIASLSSESQQVFAQLAAQLPHEELEILRQYCETMGLTLLLPDVRPA